MVIVLSSRLVCLCQLAPNRLAPAGGLAQAGGHSRRLLNTTRLYAKFARHGAAPQLKGCFSQRFAGKSQRWLKEGAALRAPRVARTAAVLRGRPLCPPGLKSGAPRMSVLCCWGVARRTCAARAGHQLHVSGQAVVCRLVSCQALRACQFSAVGWWRGALAPRVARTAAVPRGRPLCPPGL